MHGFWIKGTKEQKCWIKLIQGLKWQVKDFSVLVSIESLILTLNVF